MRCRILLVFRVQSVILNNTITTQGYENQLNTQRLAAQMQNQCCELSRQIEQEGCKNRELQRQIQTEAITMALADAKAQNAALTAQIGFQNSQNASRLIQNYNMDFRWLERVIFSIGE